MLNGLDFLWLALAGMAAGLVNAIAGGGTLITFPVLTAIGIPAVAANVTNTIALCPGLLGGITAQRRDLAGQSRRLWVALPFGAIGGLAGGLLLLHTEDRAFRAVVPYLILGATALLAIQKRLAHWLLTSPTRATRHTSLTAVVVAVSLAAVYGGYFGAGLGVILLAVLGLALDDSLARLNAFKQTIALVVNLTAAILFLFSGKVVWPAVLVQAAGAIIGGSVGGRVASRVKPGVLRAVVVVVGLTVGIVYLQD